MCKLSLQRIKKLILYNVLTECSSTQKNWILKLQIYSIIENLKQKCFNFFILGGSKKSLIFSLSVIKR